MAVVHDLEKSWQRSWDGSRHGISPHTDSGFGKSLSRTRSVSSEYENSNERRSRSKRKESERRSSKRSSKSVPDERENVCEVEEEEFLKKRLVNTRNRLEEYNDKLRQITHESKMRVITRNVHNMKFGPRSATIDLAQLRSIGDDDMHGSFLNLNGGRGKQAQRGSISHNMRRFSDNICEVKAPSQLATRLNVGTLTAQKLETDLTEVARFSKPSVKQLITIDNRYAPSIEEEKYKPSKEPPPIQDKPVSVIDDDYPPLSPINKSGKERTPILRHAASYRNTSCYDTVPSPFDRLRGNY